MVAKRKKKKTVYYEVVDEFYETDMDVNIWARHTTLKAGRKAVRSADAYSPDRVVLRKVTVEIIKRGI